jgi:hypothetical protein
VNSASQDVAIQNFSQNSDDLYQDTWVSQTSNHKEQRSLNLLEEYEKYLNIERSDVREFFAGLSPQTLSDYEQYSSLFYAKFGLNKLWDFRNKILKCPISAAPIEQQFSVVSDTLTPKRSQLSGEKIGNLVLLKNYDSIVSFLKSV